MRTIMVMFDTLTRKFLPNYGGWIQAPNFQRLKEHCTQFDNFYAGSLPCMPARRELHTGKYNFLHRGWGPLEPFDRSVMEVLRTKGVYTHLITDHSHYWEDGGATYHNRYGSWEGFRGQEGDRYVPRDIAPTLPPDRHELNKTGISVTQHYRNRSRQQTQEEMSSCRTFQAGLDFLAEHESRDNWFVQIEAFDPHEPFYVPQKYRARYGLPVNETLNWPRYGLMPDCEDGGYHQDLMNAKKEYAALMTMCDENLGRILDFMDEHDMWKDTALIVNTDHGFLLGEHDCLGKNFPPMYDELVHLPFFLHVPDLAEGGNISQLCTTVDIVPTLLELYGCDLTAMGEMDGRSILSVLRNGSTIHEHVLFGVHGSYTCITDGEHVYMKANAKEENQPLYEYTMMPTNIRGFFSPEQMAQAVIVSGGRFSNGIPCMRMPAQTSQYCAHKFGDRLYNVVDDPKQMCNLLNEENQKIWNQTLACALKSVDAPEEEALRLGLC